MPTTPSSPPSLDPTEQKNPSKAVTLQDKESPKHLDKEELAFYNNMKDWKWRIENLYYIVDKNGKKVKFKPNWAQRRVLDSFWFFNIILKARQLGITTFFCIVYLDQVLFKANKTAGIIAHTDSDTKKNLPPYQVRMGESSRTTQGIYRNADN